MTRGLVSHENYYQRKKATKQQVHLKGQSHEMENCPIRDMFVS